MLQEAARGQAAVFTGQLAAAVTAATRHLFASDLLLAGAEALAGGGAGGSLPKRVVVPVVVLQVRTAAGLSACSVSCRRAPPALEP
jgi:hypothetical protein